MFGQYSEYNILFHISDAYTYMRKVLYILQKWN